MATESMPTLEANVREKSGKGVARQTRMKGMIPAICYGRGMENISLSIDPDEFEKLKARPRKVNTLFTLALDNGEKVENVMLRDYQFDPVRRTLTHVDLIAVDMDKPIKTNVPVTTIGRARGVAMGGRLRFIHPDVQIVARPADIPEQITVDVTELAPDGAIMASELDYPEGVEPAFKVDYAMLRIQMPRVRKAKVEEDPKKKGKAAAKKAEA